MRVYTTPVPGTTKLVEHWYDRTGGAGWTGWWCRLIDAEKNQLGDAQHAYRKRDILRQVVTMRDDAAKEAAHA